MPGKKSNIPKDLNLDTRYHPIHSKQTKEKIGKKSLKLWKDPKYRKQRNESLLEYWADDDNKEVRKKIMQDICSTKEWQSKSKEGREKLRNDPARWKAYRKKYLLNNKKKYDNPEYWEKYYASIKVRKEKYKEEQKEWIEKSRQKICKKVNAGEKGVFNSFVDAARAYGWFGNNNYPNSERVRARCKSKTFPDWYVIDEKK